MPRYLLLALCVLLAGGCGPTELEAGQGLLLAAPIITLIGAGLSALYALLWRPLEPKLRFSWRNSVYVTAGQTAVIIGVLFYVGQPQSMQGSRLDDWILIVLWLVGTSYISLQLIVLRLAMLPGLQQHYSLLSMLPWVVIYPSALWFGVAGTGAEFDSVTVVFWILPGYGGMTTLPIALLLSLELFLRRRKLARSLREPPYPAPMPKAQARYTKR